MAAGWKQSGIRTGRELRSFLVRTGCVRLRCRGSHETWQTPGGQLFTVIRKQEGRPPSRSDVLVARQALQKEGVRLP